MSFSSSSTLPREEYPASFRFIGHWQPLSKTVSQHNFTSHRTIIVTLWRLSGCSVARGSRRWNEEPFHQDSTLCVEQVKTNAPGSDGTISWDGIMLALLLALFGSESLASFLHPCTDGMKPPVIVCSGGKIFLGGGNSTDSRCTFSSQARY